MVALGCVSSCPVDPATALNEEFVAPALEVHHVVVPLTVFAKGFVVPGKRLVAESAIVALCTLESLSRNILSVAVQRFVAPARTRIEAVSARMSFPSGDIELMAAKGFVAPARKVHASMSLIAE